MLRFLPAALLLAALTPLAHANSFDDLTITGNGQVITFTLPTTSSQYEYFRTDRVGFGGGNTGAINGVTGLPVSTDFYFAAELFYGSFQLFIGDTSYNFYGASPVSVTTGPLELYDYDLATATLIPNTYDLFTIDFNPFTRTDYTLTVTPDASVATTPEPATLTLLATGTLGLLATLRRRGNRLLRQ